MKTTHPYNTIQTECYKMHQLTNGKYYIAKTYFFHDVTRIYFKGLKGLVYARFFKKYLDEYFKPQYLGNCFIITRNGGRVDFSIDTPIDYELTRKEAKILIKQLRND